MKALLGYAYQDEYSEIDMALVDFDVQLTHQLQHALQHAQESRPY